MVEEKILQVGALLNSAKIPEIPGDTNFWMMRAKSGFFYDEFVKDEFIALGWNYVDSKTSYDKENLERVKEGIKHWYGDKVPTTAINKCRRFIEEFKEGDYIVIPNKGSTKIAICKVGKYFENESLDTRKEIQEIKKIENKEYEIGSVKCPYRKRRKVDVLLQVSTKRIGHKLLKAIGSYHGLNDMNEYATDILNCLYDCYVFQENIMFSINVAKKDPIGARELSKLMYGVSEVFCELTDEENVSVTINLNSPGKVTVWLQKGYNALKKGAPTLLILTLVLFGGGAEGIVNFNGLLPGVIETVKEIRLMDIEEKKAEEELKGQQLDNYLKAMELIEKSGENEIDVEKVLKNLEFLTEIGGDLEFESNRKFAEDTTDVVIEEIESIEE